MCKTQHGFEKHHSTVTNLILHCDVVYKQFGQNELTLTQFLDVAKTFDSVSHNIILYQLAKISFDHEIFQVFASYLTKKTKYIFFVIHCPIPAKLQKVVHRNQFLQCS